MTRWSSARWLRAFRAAGGMAWMTTDFLLGIGWKVNGYSDAQHAEARRLIAEIDSNERRWSAVLQRVANGG